MSASRRGPAARSTLIAITLIFVVIGAAVGLTPVILDVFKDSEPGRILAGLYTAAGAVIAALTAVALWAEQERSAADRRREEQRERVLRTVSALNAELDVKLRHCRSNHAPEKSSDYLEMAKQLIERSVDEIPMTFAVNDNFVFDEARSLLGDLDNELATAIVNFYSLDLEITRLAEEMSKGAFNVKKQDRRKGVVFHYTLLAERMTVACIAAKYQIERYLEAQKAEFVRRDATALEADKALLGALQNEKERERRIAELLGYAPPSATGGLSPTVTT